MNPLMQAIMAGMQAKQANAEDYGVPPHVVYAGMPREEPPGRRGANPDSLSSMMDFSANRTGRNIGDWINLIKQSFGGTKPDIFQRRSPIGPAPQYDPNDPYKGAYPGNGEQAGG